VGCLKPLGNLSMLNRSYEFGVWSYELLYILI
jgi:hypothetical protein